MAELLRRQSSKYDNTHSGCMWGLLQFFDFHQRLHMRKMLAYKRHTDGKRTGETKIPTSEQNVLSDGETHMLEREASFQMENKITAANKSFGKTLMISLLKMSKKQDKKQVSLSASQLLRTISIHHSECNDYVLPDEITSDRESSTVELNSLETDPSASSEHVLGPDGPIFGKQHEIYGTMNPSAVMEKLIEAKEALLTQKVTDANAALQLNDLLNKIELFNANRDLLLEVLQDPNFILANYLQASSADIVLTKSASFPVARLSGRSGGKSILKNKVKESDSFLNQELKSQAGNSPSTSNTIEELQAVVSIAGVDVGILKSGPATVNTAGVGSKNGKTGLNRWKDFKQRINDVIKENRKEHRRISMDGVLHKVPFGQKLPEDVEKEKVGDIPRSKLGSDGSIYGNSKFAHKNVQKSQSLTESMDRYSQLLESISVREPKRPLERLKSIQEDGGLQYRKSPKTFGRIFSSPEFRLYSFSKDVQSEVSHAALSSEKPASDVFVGDEAVDTSGSDELKPDGTLENAEESMESDKFVQSAIKLNPNDIMGSLEQPVLIDEHDQSATCMVSDDLIAEDSSYVPLPDLENEMEVDPSDKLTKPSPVSVLDSHFQEEHVSPAKYAVSEGSELQSNWMHLEELDSVANPQNQLGNGDSEGVELIKENFDKEQIPDTHDINSFHVHVDHKDEAEFNYVRDVLRKSGLIGGAEGSPHELDTTIVESFDMPLDHQLMFDLINEVLLEIYESSIAQSTGFSRFDRRIRPLPVGNHVLEEVWAKISWHLGSQKHLNPTLDYFVARDFVKNDAWMDLHWDVEHAGVKFECLILDDLLDEIILDSGVV